MGKFDRDDIAYRAFKLYIKKQTITESEELKALWNAAFQEGQLLGEEAWLRYMAIRGDELYPEEKEEK